MKHLKVRQLANASFCEYFIHGQCRSGHNIGQTLTEIVQFCTSHDATVVYVRFFVKRSLLSMATTVLGSIASRLQCPVTWILQPEKEAISDFSFQAYAVSGITVRPIYDHGQVAGCRFGDQNANYLHMAVVSTPCERVAHSARYVFDTMQARLRSGQSDFSHTIRTWLFADDILSWYGQLNQERDRFFQQHGIFSKLVPASTGIGAANPFGSALIAELTAVEPLNERTRIEKVVSPMQCEALNYKSSFSRAVAVMTPNYRKLYVSGTASIGADGRTEHVNDCAGQIDLTMRVVGALLANGGMTWADSAQAIAYFKHCEDFDLFDAYCQNASMEIPHVKLEADICREELLFELELSLCRPNT